MFRNCQSATVYRWTGGVGAVGVAVVFECRSAMVYSRTGAGPELALWLKLFFSERVKRPDTKFILVLQL